MIVPIIRATVLQSGRSILILSWPLRNSYCRTSGSKQRSHLRKFTGAVSSVGEALVDFVHNHNGKVQGISVVPMGEVGYGLVANKAMEPGSPLVLLPGSCCLTYAEGSDPRLLSLIEKVPEELWGGRLALQVLAHRIAGGTSPFQAYVKNLPVGISGLPLFFSKEAHEGLQYAPVRQQVDMRCRWLLHFCRDFLEPLRGTLDDPFGGHPVDANLLGWALGVVTSRAFRVWGQEKPAAMLPLIDMCNHSGDPNCKVRPHGGTPGGVQLESLRPLRAGEALSINYGDLPNDFFLLDYGFVVEDNPHDYIELRYDLAMLEAGREIAGLKAVDLTEEQRQMLQELGLGGVGGSKAISHVRLYRNKQQCPVLAAARVLAQRDASSLRQASLKQLPALANDSIPLPQDLEACKTVVGVATLLLAQFPTSIKEDVELLRGADGAPSPLPDNVQLAVRFRMEKKKILNGYLQHMAQAIKERMKAVSMGEHAVEEGVASKAQARKQGRPRPKGFGAK
eukprot:jgi/Botrbrau1/23212/Bobra.0041s0056.1